MAQHVFPVTAIVSLSDDDKRCASDRSLLGGNGFFTKQLYRYVVVITTFARGWSAYLDQPFSRHDLHTAFSLNLLGA